VTFRHSPNLYFSRFVSYFRTDNKKVKILLPRAGGQTDRQTGRRFLKVHTFISAIRKWTGPVSREITAKSRGESFRVEKGLCQLVCVGLCTKLLLVTLEVCAHLERQLLGD